MNKCPWGRDLHILTHRLPRRCKRGQDWELERGFHLQVVSESHFEFTLRARQEADSPTLPLLPSHNSEQQEKFLIWHTPGAYSTEGLLKFAERLGSEFPYHVGLILSQPQERGSAMADFAKHRSAWRAVQEPVVQVFQDYPPHSYFSVEKSLFDLGRVGRRLLRLGKIRRLMPW